MLSAAAAADEDFLYGSSPGTDTDGMASMAQGAAARVWASGYQDQDQVGRPSHFNHLYRLGNRSGRVSEFSLQKLCFSALRGPNQQTFCILLT